MPEDPEAFIYFAYGPELRTEKMAELCPGARRLEPARIPHHTISFTGRSPEWDGGTATIALAPGRDLWGGLYRIDASCRGELESWGRAEGYVWCWTAVLSADAKRTRVGLLVKVRGLDPTTPAPEYLKRLQEAWREWELEAVPVPGARPGESG